MRVKQRKNKKVQNVWFSVEECLCSHNMKFCLGEDWSSWIFLSRSQRREWKGTKWVDLGREEQRETRKMKKRKSIKKVGGEERNQRIFENEFWNRCRLRSVEFVLATYWRKFRCCIGFSIWNHWKMESEDPISNWFAPHIFYMSPIIHVFTIYLRQSSYAGQTIQSAQPSELS